MSSNTIIDRSKKNAGNTPRKTIRRRSKKRGLYGDILEFLKEIRDFFKELNIVSGGTLFTAALFMIKEFYDYVKKYYKDKEEATKSKINKEKTIIQIENNLKDMLNDLNVLLEKFSSSQILDKTIRKEKIKEINDLRQHIRDINEMYRTLKDEYFIKISSIPNIPVNKNTGSRSAPSASVPEQNSPLNLGSVRLAPLGIFRRNLTTNFNEIAKEEIEDKIFGFIEEFLTQTNNGELLPKFMQIKQAYKDSHDRISPPPQPGNQFGKKRKTRKSRKSRKILNSLN